LFSRKIQNILATVVLVLALVALIFQNRIWDWWQERKLYTSDRPKLAEITELTHNVKVRLPESLTYYSAKKYLPLHDKDTVSTDASSTAVITFNTGLQVELEANSLITIEDATNSNGSLELTFLRGRVKVLNQGKGRGLSLPPTALVKPKSVIEDEGPTIDLSMLDQTPTPSPTVAPTPLPRVDLEENRAKERAQTKRVEEKETLPDSYIASIIHNQRTFLNRCYAQYLRLNPDARGRIDCLLTIEPDGTISTARVVASTIPDPTLQQCVVSILQRAKFKSFKGDPIIVTYPLSFE
jgi:hypothetical protein